MTNQLPDEATGYYLYTIIENSRKLSAALHKDGIPALIRMVEIAEYSSSSQAETVRCFLLGLYNGEEFPFNLTRLRSLDDDLREDCLSVLHMDSQHCIKEIHEYITDGAAKFLRMARSVTA